MVNRSIVGLCAYSDKYGNSQISEVVLVFQTFFIFECIITKTGKSIWCFCCRYKNCFRFLGIYCNFLKNGQAIILNPFTHVEPKIPPPNAIFRKYLMEIREGFVRKEITNPPQ